jgi:hypothetical protein
VTSPTLRLKVIPVNHYSENSKKITQIPDVIASIDKTVYNQLAVKILTSKLDLN